MRFAMMGSSVVCAAACAAALAGCGQKSAGPKGKAKIEFSVDVAPVDLREVGFVVTAPGTIVAFEQVQITARVGGAVDQVKFAEGQEVKAGQVLAVIEVDRYQVAVNQAQAAVDRAAATQAQAEQNLTRRQQSNEAHPGLIAGEEIQTYQTAVQTAKADVAAAKEQVKVAQLNLRDAFVRAPIAGIIQTRAVVTGQYLTPGTILGTLLQRDPLLLKFQLTEADAPRITPGMIVTLSLRETRRTYKAKVTLVSGSADPASHLVPVTAQIDDTEHKYWLRPGVFCDVSIPVGVKRKAAVIPELAIRASERGFLAYVVQDNVAKEHIVELGMHTGDGFVEVTQGLAEGEMLVVHGADPLAEGSLVKIAAKTTLEAFDAGGPTLVTPPPMASGPAAGLATGPMDAGARR
jgi:RND family efflux transporter MFP subunit